MGKDVAWKWGPLEQSAFENLKTCVTSAPVLVFPDEHRPYCVEADSSDFATGAVISQQSLEDDKWHPIAFMSKSLSAVERNYEIHDKEMLVIIRSLEEWRHFLEGTSHRFEIWTDHKNLKYFITAKKLNRRQARWSLLLSRFDFLLHHRPGCSMGKPDALSRRADHGTGTDDNADVTFLRIELFSSPIPSKVFAVRAIQHVLVEGKEKEILKEIRRGNRDGKQEDVVALAAKGLLWTSGKSLRTSEWAMPDGLLTMCDKVYVPCDPELRRRIVHQHHDMKIAGHLGR